jgi:hypothetical protein
MTLRTALLFQAGNFVGREYLHALEAADMMPDLIASVGRMSVNARALADAGIHRRPIPRWTSRISIP